MTSSQVNFAELAQPLSASTGSIEVSQADGGGQLVVVRATRKKGALLWVLELTVTNQGRANGGSFVYAGRTWKITPGTGQLRLDRAAPAGQPATFKLVSTGAITATESTAPTVNTPIVVTIVGSTPPSP